MGKVIEGRFGKTPSLPEPTKERSQRRMTPDQDARHLLRISSELLPKRNMINAIVNRQYTTLSYNDALHRLTMGNNSNSELVALVLSASEAQIKLKPGYYAALNQMLNDRWNEIIDDPTIFDA